MRLIVTRPAAQAEPWVQALRDLGLQAQALPLIDIAPAPDLGAVHSAWNRLDELALVMFVSANAVDSFFAARPAQAHWPEGLAAASTGPGTSAALRAQGLSRVVEPSPEAGQFDSEALWAQWASKDWTGAQVLVVRGEDGRDWLADQFSGSGAQVGFVAAYRRLPPQWGAQEQGLLAQALAAPEQHLWLFSSSQAISHLQALAPHADWSASAAVASHPRMVQAARAAGFGRVDLVAPGPQAVAAHLMPGSAGDSPAPAQPGG